MIVQSEFDLRQVRKMLQCIEEFMHGEMSIGKLYGNLEFLWHQLENSDPESILPIHLIHELEILNAGLLENLSTYQETILETNRVIRKIKVLLERFNLNHPNDS